jgi:hypothetical protein
MCLQGYEKRFFYLQVRPPAWKFLNPDGLIFVDFILVVVGELIKYLEKFGVPYNLTNVTDLLYVDICTFMTSLVNSIMWLPSVINNNNRCSWIVTNNNLHYLFM